MKNEKKPSKEQLENRVKNAVLFVPRDREYLSVYFKDKGLRLESTDDFAIVSTTSHSHIFHKITPSGVSRPYLYVKQMITFAMAYTDASTDGRSYAAMMERMKAKEDQSDYNVAWYVDKWLFNIFAPLYTIGEDYTSAFLVYESFLHNVARNDITLREHVSDVTNVEFMKELTQLLQEYAKDWEPQVVFEKMSDEERVQGIADAMKEQEQQMGVQ